jgi:hypothetical protein
VALGMTPSSLPSEPSNNGATNTPMTADQIGHFNPCRSKCLRAKAVFSACNVIVIIVDVENLQVILGVCRLTHLLTSRLSCRSISSRSLFLNDPLHPTIEAVTVLLRQVLRGDDHDRDVLPGWA